MGKHCLLNSGRQLEALSIFLLLKTDDILVQTFDFE